MTSNFHADLANDIGLLFKNVEVLKLWVASDELDLQKLITFIQSYVADKKIDYLRNDPVQFIQTTFRYETCKSLRDFCIDSICAEPKILLNCYSPQRGPSFGDGWDLTIETDCSLYSHSNNSYNDITKFIPNTTRLNLEDYEVFQLIHRN
ncbi:9495_t:CDS:2 [Diversispora eburnea]|uniref:9495_t:CDS:1 n=1 Tax=Diversispora eburnea TaxID=1213867 RepID=A0A9N8V1C7_9GLOM|nr:9495_t:CDS:2 [Diversispora eburnea]